VTDDDADEMDDAGVKSMRAVWLSMRDEEPPAAGMSALLAAAREKAEQMTKPSWFERAAAFLKRPPALAFATVMVLIGGAVLVTRNTDKKTESEVSNAAPMTPEPAEVRSRDTAAQQPQMAPADEMTPPTVNPHAGMGSGAVATPIEAPPPEKPAVKKPKEKLAHKDLEKEAPPKLDALEDKKPDKPTKTVKGPKVEFGGVREGGVVDSRGDGAGTTLGTDSPTPSMDPTTPPPPPPPKPPTAKQESVDEELDTVTVTGSKKPTTPPVEQLARQAESAATRGDCAAVKVIVARIKKQDESYYKTRVATNAAIKKCL
jgi:hypothetical protein